VQAPACPLKQGQHFRRLTYFRQQFPSTYNFIGICDDHLYKTLKQVNYHFRWK
jgi:hypothetical protein